MCSGVLTLYVDALVLALVLFALMHVVVVVVVAAHSIDWILPLTTYPPHPSTPSPSRLHPDSTQPSYPHPRL